MLCSIQRALTNQTLDDLIVCHTFDCHSRLDESRSPSSFRWAIHSFHHQRSVASPLVGDCCIFQRELSPFFAPLTCCKGLLCGFAVSVE